MLRKVLPPLRATRARALLGAWLFSLAASSCARRAPGPEECHALAVQWVAREPRLLPRFGGIVIEAAESKILERTTACLTTPYDRELVRCVGSGASPGACFRAFERRRAGGPGLP